MVDGAHTPSGDSDTATHCSLVNTDNTGQYTWTLVLTVVEQQKVTFTPHGDGASDTVVPYVFTQQNRLSVTIQISDATGHVVRVLDKEKHTTQTVLTNGNRVHSDLGLSTDMRLELNAYSWDGQVYDTDTGKYDSAPDGQYTYRLVTET